MKETPVIVRSLDEISDTDDDIKTKNWRSRRIVLAREKVGFSFHETILYAGTESTFQYANHIELVHCIEGEAELVNEETGEEFTITPGTLYLLNGHEKHTVRPKTDFRVLCVFNPPVTGREVHDENGVYPLIVEDDAENATA